MELQYTRELDDILTGAIALAGMDRARLVTPEHILMVALGNPKVMAALNQVTSDALIGAVTKKDLKQWMLKITWSVFLKTTRIPRSCFPISTRCS